MKKVSSLCLRFFNIAQPVKTDKAIIQLPQPEQLPTLGIEQLEDMAMWLTARPLPISQGNSFF
jgi:hypothetical protein